MNSWEKEVVPLTMKGQIAVPYTWWVGETGSRFLLALRDEEKILGNRCERCGTTYVPPRKNCGLCFVPIDHWVELSKEGVVTSHTIVRQKFQLQPANTPFAYAIICLDGADVGLVHLIKDNLEKLKNGIRVRARFKEKAFRKGDLRDIDCFDII